MCKVIADNELLKHGELLGNNNLKRDWISTLLYQFSKTNHHPETKKGFRKSDTLWTFYRWYGYKSPISSNIMTIKIKKLRVGLFCRCSGSFSFRLHPNLGAQKRLLSDSTIKVIHLFRRGRNRSSALSHSIRMFVRKRGPRSDIISAFWNVYAGKVDLYLSGIF